MYVQVSALEEVQGEVKEWERKERRAKEEGDAMRLEAQRHKDSAAASEAKIRWVGHGRQRGGDTEHVSVAGRVMENGDGRMTYRVCLLCV
jgi:hypothetical protein